MNYLIVGGGLVGLGTALALQQRQPHARIEVLEKESEVGRHQSTHNSGVLHAGLYYKPGSLKARLAVQGIRQMTTFCQEHGIAHEICGKLVVATTQEECGRLRTLLHRGQENGLRGLRWLEGEAAQEIEPATCGLAAVHVPEEGIVDYDAVVRTMARLFVERGGVIQRGAKVTGLRLVGTEWRATTSAGTFTGDFLVNCAGLHCDRIAEAAGEPRTTRIVPFRGEYYQLKPEAQRLVRNLIYPVPDPTFPFLGVHYTRLIHGGVEAGPNAVLALAREGYRHWHLNPGELWDAVTYRGLWAFMRQHRRMAWDEVRRSLSKRLFCASLQKLVPAIQESDLCAGGAGVRAQALSPDGQLIQDFQLIPRARALHVLNAPSPAATASLAIGGEIAAAILEQPSPSLAQVGSRPYATNHP